MSTWKAWKFEREYNESLSDAIREDELGHHAMADRLFAYAEEVRQAALFYVGIELA